MYFLRKYLDPHPHFIAEIILPPVSKVSAGIRPHKNKTGFQMLISQTDISPLKLLCCSSFLALLILQFGLDKDKFNKQEIVESNDHLHPEKI